MSSRAKWFWLILVLLVALGLHSMNRAGPGKPGSSPSLAVVNVPEARPEPVEASGRLPADEVASSGRSGNPTEDGVPSSFQVPKLAFADAPILIEEVSEPDSEGLVTKVTIQKTEFKYPYIRIVERRRASGTGEVVDRQVMIADHALVTKRKDLSEEAFSELIRAAAGEVLKRVNDHGLYMIGFEAKSAGALEEFLGRVARLAPAGSVTAEPDYLRFARESSGLPS